MCEYSTNACVITFCFKENAARKPTRSCIQSAYLSVPVVFQLEVASSVARASQVWLKHDVGTLSQTRTRPPAKGQLSRIIYSCVLCLPVKRFLRIANINYIQT